MRQCARIEGWMDKASRRIHWDSPVQLGLSDRRESALKEERFLWPAREHAKSREQDIKMLRGDILHSWARSTRNNETWEISGKGSLRRWEMETWGHTRCNEWEIRCRKGYRDHYQEQAADQWRNTWERLCIVERFWWDILDTREEKWSEESNIRGFKLLIFMRLRVQENLLNVSFNAQKDIVLIQLLTSWIHSLLQ